ncbi:hypothetical protein ASJ33_05500 [Dehalococcoides mccartyi]|uniref:YopX family protein n=1 Tax=Dehalococcoides mccartyi TaxID=61435 RepID=UPI00090ABFBE|nr:YopX family protein [Dehalococcoides mccartyi]APH12644.1 hypothetical protein ASJ33_05500 [Dehalococcoides mccartyi]
MTREIKFRGKRVDTGEWVFGYFAYISDGTTEHKKIPVIFTGDTGYNLYEELVIKRFEVIPETVGQYTGLKDKNGKEIYEGDIATIAWHPEEPLKKIKNLWVVRYSGWKFNAEPNRETLKPLGSTYAEVLEVIGNIYDNPELLKEIK